MTPIDPKSLHKLIPVKKRKKGERRYKGPPISLVTYGVFVKGSGKHHLGGKGFECNWCARIIPHDGRPYNVCDYHWWKELWRRIYRELPITNEAWDHYEKVMKIVLEKYPEMLRT